MEQHNHTLDSEGEICIECGLFEEFFLDIPECPAMDDDADGEEEDTEKGKKEKQRLQHNEIKRKN